MAAAAAAAGGGGSGSTGETSTRLGFIFLHGLGDTPRGWSGLRRTIERSVPNFPSTEWVFPRAPTAHVTISGAQQTSWFDLYDWPLAVGCKDDREGLLQSVAHVHTLIDDLVAKGIPASRIIIGGFSQGAAVTLLAAHRYPKTLLGCICLSGWLTLKEDWESSRVEGNSTPVFLGHGVEDGVVLPGHVAVARETLEGADLSLSARVYDHMQHSSCPEEMRDLMKWLSERISA